MIERFEGVTGKRLLAEALADQRIVHGNVDIANELLDVAQLRELETGDVLITRPSLHTTQGDIPAAWASITQIYVSRSRHRHPPEPLRQRRLLGFHRTLNHHPEFGIRLPHRQILHLCNGLFDLIRRRREQVSPAYQRFHIHAIQPRIEYGHRQIA